MSEEEAVAENIDLVFDGLDTFAVAELVRANYSMHAYRAGLNAVDDRMATRS